MIKINREEAKRLCEEAGELAEAHIGDVSSVKVEEKLYANKDSEIILTVRVEYQEEDA